MLGFADSALDLGQDVVFLNSASQETGEWGSTPLISALRRHELVDFCEFGASLVYRVSSRTGSKKKTH